MFRQVISRVVPKIQTVKNVQMCTNSDTTKMEKTPRTRGRVGADPQRRGNEEHPVVTFSLATHSNYKYMNGDFMQRTEWHKVCVFKPNLRDAVVNYLKKGQRVLVSGKISYGEYKDEQGNIKPSTAVIADDVIFFQAT